MKYFLIALISLVLIVVSITAGCIDTNQSSPSQVPTMSTQSPTPISVKTIVPTTSTLSDTFVMPTNPADVTEQNMNRVLMECKDENNFNSYPMGYSTSPVCVRAYELYVGINKHVPPNPFEAKGASSLELLHCIQGMGTLEDCYVIGEKNGFDRTSMKKMWCETNSC